MSTSDTHYGTRQSFAGHICHMEENTFSHEKCLLGDIVDGVRLVNKEVKKFGHPDPEKNWHREALAHYLRKAADGCKITYIPGNHDDVVRLYDLSGKTIYGIEVKNEDTYVDPVSGFTWLRAHGDDFDQAAFGKDRDFWYDLGDRGEDALIYLDNVKVHFDTIKERFRSGGAKAGAREALDEFDDWFQQNTQKEFWLAPAAKKATKRIIYHWLGVRDEVVKSLKDRPGIDGVMFGHLHLPFIDNTRKGSGMWGSLLWQFTNGQVGPDDKLMMNGGCGTEKHPQAIWGDGNGVYALVEWHVGKGIKILGEFDSLNRTISTKRRFISWEELGLNSRDNPEFYGNAHHYKDQHKQKADHLIALIHEVWPPLQTSRNEDAIRQVSRRGRIVHHQRPAAGSQPRPRRDPKELLVA
jgi:UDP-2,3-diacylglucosamine pyrophosphatase LpxH